MAIYMKYGSVKGDVTTQGFKDYIELNSLQWGVGRGISSPIGSDADREASNPSISEVTVTKAYDIASSDLLKESLSGDGKAKAIIAFTRTKAGGTGSETFLQVTLDDVMISGYSLSSGGDRPSESLSLNFTKMEFANTPMTATGTPGTPVKVNYDLGLMKMS